MPVKPSGSPFKKKVKKLKIKGMRAVRAPRQSSTKKPNVKQIVNIYTTKSDLIDRRDYSEAKPFKTDFRQPIQNPFEPVFNYLPVPSVQPSVAIPPIVHAPVQQKEKRKYTKKPVAIGVAVEGGYESAFMPSERETEILQREKIRKIDEELARQRSDAEFMSGDISPVILKKKGRPKKKSEPQFSQPVGQTDISQFFGKDKPKPKREFIIEGDTE